MSFAPQRRALFQHLNFQKWSEAEVFCTFSLRNRLRATTACNFSSLISPAGSAPAALASLLFNPQEPQNHQKTQCFATFLPFRAPASSFFWSFLFWLFSLLTAFSSLHIVGSLTSKLPWASVELLSAASHVYLSMHLSINLSICLCIYQFLSIHRSNYLSIYLSICLSIDQISLSLSLYISVCLSICPSTWLCLYPSISLFVLVSNYLSMCLCIYLSISPSISLAVSSDYLSICLSVHLSMYLSICLSIYLSVYLSIYLSVYLSIYLSVCLSIYLSIYLSFFYLTAWCTKQVCET